MSIRVLLVDDHPVVRTGLRVVLENEPDFDVVGEADSATLAIDLACRLRPNVVLTDLLLPDTDGVAVTQCIRDHCPDTQVVILTTVDEEDAAVVRAVRAGAIGYVLKSADMDVLVSTIRSAAEGQVRLSPRAAARLIQEMRTPAHEVALTVREREVLREVTIGRTNKEIGKSLYIAETTVKSHVQAILDKLGVQSRTQAALLAIRAEHASAGEARAAGQRIWPAKRRRRAPHPDAVAQLVGMESRRPSSLAH
jgi:DNA-binding NarL/FixJ family response regulator